MFDNYIFVGNSMGIIRVFDTKSNKEMKPLLDATLSRNKVTCISITQDGGYLIAGYKKGTLVLWDLTKYKLIKAVDDAHESEVTSV
jgi:WD40 repeat protein